jgi:hypothetical protein
LDKSSCNKVLIFLEAEYGERQAGCQDNIGADPNRPGSKIFLVKHENFLYMWPIEKSADYPLAWRHCVMPGGTKGAM